MFIVSALFTTINKLHARMNAENWNYYITARPINNIIDIVHRVIFLNNIICI